MDQSVSQLNSAAQAHAQQHTARQRTVRERNARNARHTLVDGAHERIEIVVALEPRLLRRARGDLDVLAALKPARFDEIRLCC
jgi:hypothetical protein